MTVSYNGFISYSHAADGRLAPAVQRGLHHLAKPWNRRRALWIFRDQTGLSVTPALWSSIQRAIDSSDYFVLMASPEAAQSPWVNREIEHWVATKSADKILPVVTDGEWRWDRRKRDFDESSTAVPAALRGVFDEEPLHLDLRWARDDRHLSLRHSRFRDAIAQLAAPMHGITKDDLEGEDVRQHRRAARLRWGAVTSLALLTLLASVTGMFAVQNAAEANASALEAVRQQQEATVQRGSAAKFAGEAQRQQEMAERQEARARDAAAEAQRQLGRADSAAARAARQQQLAERQNALARESAREMRRQQQRAEEQAQIAREQQRLAGTAGAEARRQKQIAKEQERLAAAAGAEAREQEKIAQEQERLAAEAGAEARKQERIAKEQEKRAEAAKADADREKANAERERINAEREKANAEREKANAEREKANADQQQRIAISRRLINEAKATLQNDPQTALRRGIAAQQIHPEAETRLAVANLIASTRYAGDIPGVAAVQHGPGSLLLTLDATGVVSLWDTTSRADSTLLATIGTAGPLNNTMSLSRDGTVLALARDGVGELWDVSVPSRPALITALPTDRYYHSAVLSPDGRILVTGDRTGPDGYATLWDVTDRTRPRQLSTLQGSNFSGDNFVFSADGRTLVDSVNGTHIWDISSPSKPVGRATIPATGSNFALAFSPTEPLLAIGNSLGELNLYDLTNTAKPVRTAQLQYDVTTLMLSLAFSADGDVLASGDSDGRAILWQMGAYPRQIADMTGTGGIESLAFSGDGRTLVTADSADTAVLWNTTEFAAPHRLSETAAHSDRLQAMVYGSDGHSMITTGTDGTAVFWDVTDRQRPIQRVTLPVPGHDGWGRTAISPDGQLIAGAGAEDGVVILTDVSDPAKPAHRATLRTAVESPTALSFSPDGRTVAVGGDGRLELWDPAGTRTATLTFTLSSVGDVVFSPDGNTMAVTAISTVSLWDITDRTAPEQLSVLNGHGNTVLAVKFSPDGTTVMTGSYDHTAILWDVKDPAKPRRLTTLTGHEYKVSAVAFSRDGSTVATAEDGSWAILWDVSQPAKPVQIARVKLDQYHSPVDMVFSADGNTLAVGTDYGWDGRITLWDLSELTALRTDPAALGCTITGRGLTPEEWAREIPELAYRLTCAR
ncbi:TIR domain-containing protein [Actinoplanes xinjiangensis]|uniref:TIR domain-containing protein n=1 Tax=Actinoplanes xinjiangensis TaxID=512350 RepID=UPI00341D8133